MSFWEKIKTLTLARQKSIRILWLLTAILALCCIVRLALPCRQALYRTPLPLTLGDTPATYTVYDNISLRPGVYHIALHYQCGQDRNALFYAQDATVFTGGLLTNGEHAYSALDTTDFHLWLFESTDALRICLDYSGEGELVMGDLCITETRQLWTLLLTCLLFFSALAFVLLTYFYYDKKYPVSPQKKTVFLAVTMIVVIASTPNLLGGVLGGADLTYHLQRIEGVKDGLLTGQFPIRIEPKWLYGHGYADAVFYCNALFLFPALLRLLGFTVTVSFHLYCIALTLATAWIAYFCFARIFQSRTTGVICCGLYTLSIFRIYKLTIKATIGEVSALAFLPLVLYGLFRVFTEDPKSKSYKTCYLPILFGYAGILQTHVLTCEITAFLTLCACLIGIRKILRPETFLELCKGALGAILVSLWFLVPFIDYYITQDVHIKHVSARTIQGSGLSLSQALCYFVSHADQEVVDAEWRAHNFTTSAGIALSLSLLFFLLLWIGGRLREKDARLTFAKVTALLGALLLFMSTNRFPWDAIQFSHPVLQSLVSSLQFPDRVLGWDTLLLTYIAGFCLGYLGRLENKRWHRLFLALILFGVATSNLYLLDNINRYTTRFQLYNEEGMGFGYISGAEYLIEGTQDGLLTFAGPKPSKKVTIHSYEKEALHITAECSNNSKKEGHIEMPLLLYKGYRAYSGDESHPLMLRYGKNNKLRVVLPAGFSGNVTVTFQSPWYWRAAELITLSSYLFLLVLWFWRRRNQRKAPPAP